MAPDENQGTDTTPVQSLARSLAENVERVIVGKRDVVELLLVTLLCEGHVLLEDVPGVGKTMLAKSLSRSLDCTFARIQFTPDLLPTDITGVSVYNQKTADFEYRPGPVVSQVVLADEINRAGPRTQSALLEAMQERQVTVDGVTRPLPRPFLVLATQNPIELEGTFPLPEAQVDRFLMRLEMGYPEADEERTILRRFRETDPYEMLTPVVTGAQVQEVIPLCRQVFVHEMLEKYIVSIARSSRESEDFALGVSPRGTMALYRTSQALAAVRGRDYVLPDDVQYLAPFTLIHRLIPSAQTRLRGRSVRALFEELVAQVPVPVEERWSVQ
ncbi:MAG TPA: MoxR family ATPase [Anaerolineae bacterium]|nr:MoxR family ATPase [Anaerolineae bacterium]